MNQIKIDRNENLVIGSDINGITESIPVSYYGDWQPGKHTGEIETNKNPRQAFIEKQNVSLG